MKFEVEEFFYVSSNGVNKVSGKILKPTDVEIKGIVQISHGMCEYFDKYTCFSNFLMEHGFIVCGHDHIGHGDSVNSKQDRGYFASRDGYKYLIEDTKTVTNIVKEKYPELPLYLFGHSMGSLIARCYVAKYGKGLKGLILCGTVGPQPLAPAGVRLARMMSKAKGDHYRSKKLYDLALDFASIKFLPVHTRFDWLCSDEEEVRKRVDDEKSDFFFTVSAFADLFHLVSLSNSMRVIKTIPKELPIFFLSGALDPVGERGVGVKKAARLYKNIGINDVTCKIYQDDRHELMNEKNKEDIYKDVLKWINEEPIDECESIEMQEKKNEQ